MRIHDQRGYLLLEVVFATVMMAIGFFAIIEGLNRCLAAARSVHNVSIAQTLLANKSYEFRMERPTDYLDQEGRFDDYPAYTWTRKLEPTDTDYLWQQTITVFWMERGKQVGDSIVEYKYLPQKQR
jgi:Tfp pilus assembly protein PilV